MEELGIFMMLSKGEKGVFMRGRSRVRVLGLKLGGGWCQSVIMYSSWGIFVFLLCYP